MLTIPIHLLPWSAAFRMFLPFGRRAYDYSSAKKRKAIEKFLGESKGYTESGFQPSLLCVNLSDYVIPAQAGIHFWHAHTVGARMDSRLRGNDKEKET